MSPSWLRLAELLLTCVIAASGFSSFGKVNYNEAGEHVSDERLPTSVVPESYKLHLNPNMSAGYFTGYVSITIRCNEPTRSIVLHASGDLNITDDDVAVTHLWNGTATGLPISGISRNASTQTINVTVEEELVNDGLYELKLTFSGDIEDMDISHYRPTNRIQMNNGYRSLRITERQGGFFMDSYQDPVTGQESWYGGINMFPTAARRVFPCFDEPSFKATFEIVVGHLRNMSALTVMPLASTEEDDEHEGWVFDHFPPTPRVSTFSVSLLLSDLETDEPVNVTSSKGHFILQFHHKRQDSMMRNMVNATEVVPRILEYLEDYFDVAYPLPILNIAFLPKYYGPQQDSLGLIFLPDYMMYSTIPNYMPKLVNQWINHMVTPHWWSDFNVTDILGNFLMHHLLQFSNGQKWFLPDIHEQYYIASTHMNYKDYGQWMPYLTVRGEWILQMLNSSLTENTFKAAIKKLISENMYSTFTEDMLWASLTQQARVDQTLPEPVSVENITNSWLHTNKHSFPVLTVARNYDENFATLEQHIFVYGNHQNLTQEEQKTFWWIPIMYLTPDNLDPSSLQTVAWMRDERYFNISNLPDPQSFIIVNPTDAGMFLVNYDQQNWGLITQYLVSSAPNIPAATRKKLLNDAFLLASNGELNYIAALNMTMLLFSETDYSVWMLFFKRISELQQQCLWTPIEGKLNVYLKHMLQPKIGSGNNYMDYSKDPAYAMFIVTARDILHRAGYKQYENEYVTRINTTMPTFTIYDNETELVIQCPEFMKNGSEDVVTYSEQLLLFRSVYYMQRNHMERCPGFVELIERILNETLDENQTFSYHRWSSVVNLLTSNPTAHNMTFSFFVEHFEKLKQRFFFMQDIWTPLLSDISNKIKTEEGLNKLVDFYEQHKDKLGYSQRTIEDAIKKVKNEVAWGKKNLPDIEFWLDHVLPNFKNSIGVKI